MTEPEVLYNFGVLTKRYELVSRTAGQLAPGIAGLSVGFLMVLAGCTAALAVRPGGGGLLVRPREDPLRAPPGRSCPDRGRTARPLLVSATRRQDPLGDARHVVERGGRPGRHQHARACAAGPGAARRRAGACRRESARPGTQDTERPKRGGGRTRRKAGEQLPPELGRLRWMAVHFDGAEAGLLFERARRQNLLTAVISVSGGDRFVFSGPDEQAAQIFQWGEVLEAPWPPRVRDCAGSSGSSAPPPNPRRSKRTGPAAPCASVSPSEWADYQSLQAAIGTAAIHHDVYLGAQVETDTGTQADVLAEAASELAQLCEHLTSIGLRPTVLSRREIAAVMRQWADPTALERLALWGEGSIPTSGAGPAARHLGYDTLQTDGYVHRVGQIAAWPRIDVATEWMYPLLSTALAGSVRTVSMHLEAVSTEQAFAEVRDARTTGGMAQRKRDEKGIITTEDEERRVDEARSRERELTRGFRQHKIAGLVMVSSPDAETAGRAWRQAERKAVECHLDLREMHARGHEAWAATLPLCRLRFARGLL